MVPKVFDKRLCDSVKYVIHYENLQLYLRLILKLKTIYRVLELNQFKWLKIYLEFNTQKRIEAEKKWWQRWKSFVQINEQCCIWKNNEKRKKQNRYKTFKQQKKTTWNGHPNQATCHIKYLTMIWWEFVKTKLH